MSGKPSPPFRDGKDLPWEDRNRPPVYDPKTGRPIDNPTVIREVRRHMNKAVQDIQFPNPPKPPNKGGSTDDPVRDRQLKERKKRDDAHKKFLESLTSDRNRARFEREAAESAARSERMRGNQIGLT